MSSLHRRPRFGEVMRLNTRGRYGVQLMAQLACQPSGSETLGLTRIAAVTGLPWRYLEQIVRPLRAAALVKGRAGRTGGYVLAREPGRITLGDVIDATSGPISLMACVDKPETCELSDTCTSRDVWLAITAEIREVLARYTLSDLAPHPCSGCQSEAETARAKRDRGRRKSMAPPDAAVSATPTRQEAQPARRRATTKAAAQSARRRSLGVRRKTGAS